jgi:hypothetical protein
VVVDKSINLCKYMYGLPTCAGYIGYPFEKTAFEEHRSIGVKLSRKKESLTRKMLL